MTPIQQQIVTVLNNAFLTAGAELTTAHDSLLALSTPQLQAALAEFSGGSYTNDAIFSAAQTYANNQIVLDEILSGSVNAQAQGSAQLDGAPPAASISQAPANRVWLRGFGHWISLDADANSPASSGEGGGVAAGYDRAVASGVRVGAAFGYFHGHWTDDFNLTDASNDSYRLSAYGGYQGEKLSMGGALGASIDRYDATRTMGGAPFAASSHDGVSLSASAEATYRLNAGKIKIAPYVSVDYAHLEQDAFDESGGAFSLSVRPNDLDSLQPDVGVRVSRAIALAGATLIPRLGAGLRYELLDKSGVELVTLYGVASGPLTVTGAANDRALAHLSAKLDLVPASQTLHFFAEYDAELSSTERLQTAELGLSRSF